MSKRELSPSQKEIAEAIEAMDQAITKGWHYDWRTNIDIDRRECCLHGALVLAGKRKAFSMDECFAEGEAYRLHDGGPHLAWDDWDGVKTALCKKYNLGVLT